MIFNHYRDLFETCAPLFWPWLWLQLAALLALKAKDGRERLIMVTWWGQVTVLAVGDNPAALAVGAATLAVGAASAATVQTSYHALLRARFPGDALHTGAMGEAVPSLPRGPLKRAAPSIGLQTLIDRSFVAPPG